MRSPKRTSPAVERLEPRLTLSVVLPPSPIVAHPHPDVQDQAPPVPGPPASHAPAPDGGHSVAHGGMTPADAGTLEDHLDGHAMIGDPSMGHATGQVAMADNHDPSHFIASAAAPSTMPTSASAAPAHDASAPGMVMTGASMASRPMVNMPMNHSPAVMPRMIAKHADRMVVTDPAEVMDPVVAKAVHSDLERPGTGLEPDLSPALDADLGPSPGAEGMSPSMPMPSHDAAADASPPASPGVDERRSGVALAAPPAAESTPAAAFAGLALVFRLHVTPGRPRAAGSRRHPRNLLRLLRRAVRAVARRPLRRAGGGGQAPKPSGLAVPGPLYRSSRRGRSFVSSRRRPGRRTRRVPVGTIRTRGLVGGAGT